jgi:hypothetical protein
MLGLMSLRFQAIGFESVRDAESMQTYLGLIASRASKAESGVLNYRPFPGCMVNLTLDQDGGLQEADVSLEGPEQPIIPTDATAGEHGETLLRAFTCLDGAPVSPVTLHVAGGEFVPGRVCFATLGGFTRSIRAGSFDAHGFGFGEPKGGHTPFLGTIASVQRHTNDATGSSVTLIRVVLPGVVVPICTNLSVECEVGQAVTGSAEFFARLGDQVH